MTMVLLKRGDFTQEARSPYHINSLKAQGFTEVGSATLASVKEKEVGTPAKEKQKKRKAKKRR